MGWPLGIALTAMALLVRSLPAFAQPDAAPAAGFHRLWWFEPGIERGNPMPNRRFRVNAPEAVTHPVWSARNETWSSGMMQIRIAEDLRLLAGAELYLELWGGHPGTANKRVTLNGRTTYSIPEVGTARNHCTHQYPVLSLKVTDLVNGYNSVQFACDQGSAFWGHFIVDNACLRARLKPDHPDLVQVGLAGFQAAVEVRAASEDKMSLRLRASSPELISFVDFQGYYRGYNENGSTDAAAWHGFTKLRQPEAFVGRSSGPPFSLEWDVSMLPRQDHVAVQATVHFTNQVNLIYVTAPAGGVSIASRSNATVRLYSAHDLPAPFWSRAGKQTGCTIDLDIDPDEIERAELHMVIWDGGRGTTENPVTLNGRGLAVAGEGKHDVLYRKLPIDPRLLRRTGNRIEVHSDTEHHGIEVLLPGPALMIRSRAGR